MLSPHKKIIVACLISLLVFGLVIISAALARLNPAYNFAETIDLKVTGWLFNLRGKQAADPEIVIVAIDEYAFENLQKRWPWSPALHARLVDSLAH
ncbi:MAG: CHASE2 domain-containing protein, partial [Calditrichaeota bacterium]|nr:CHASE2 domain-containing protein [Calditrichota bacterium]